MLHRTVRDAQANVPADIQVPEPVRTASERVTTDKVADGVWFIASGSHNSVAIEMKDHVILVEAPLKKGRTGPVKHASFRTFDDRMTMSDGARTVQLYHMRDSHHTDSSSSSTFRRRSC